MAEAAGDDEDEREPWDHWYGWLNRDQLLPLSILQLDPADRAVLKIAGSHQLFSLIKQSKRSSAVQLRT